jgi:uncharacterized membrane protein
VEFVITFIFPVVIGLAGYLLTSWVNRTSQWKHSILLHWMIRTLPRQIDFLFVVLVLFFMAFFALSNLRRYESFGVYGFDFAVFDQTIWNSLSGLLFENTIVPDAPNLLGQRFSPILIALTPLYVLHDPRVLILIPAIASAFTIIPLYWFVRPLIGRGLAFCIAVAYFLSPGIQYSGLGQFYETILAMPLLGLTGTFLLRRQYLPFGICLGLTYLCKEEMSFVAVGLGGYIFLAQRQRKFGLALTLVGLIWGVALLEFVIPFLGGHQTYYYFGGSALYGGGHYDYLGSNIFEIAQTLFTRPDIVLQHLVVLDKITAVLQILAPWGLLSVVGAEVSALSLPTMGYTLLSNVQGQYSPSSHHWAPIFVFLMLGTAVGTNRILRWGLSKSSNRDKELLARKIGLSALILVAGGISHVLYAPNLWENLVRIQHGTSSHDALGENFVRMIPQTAIVLTQDELVTHLAQRKRVYIMSAIPCWGLADHLLVDTTRPWYSYRQGAWEDALAREYLETVAAQDGYILKRRAPLAHAVKIRFDGQMSLLGYSLPSDTLMGGHTFRPIVAWQIERPSPLRHMIAARVVDSRGHVWVSVEREPDGFCSTNHLTVGDIVSEVYSLYLPPTMPAGNYQFTLGIFERETGHYLEAFDFSGKSVGAEVTIATLRIEKNKSSVTASELQERFLLEQPYFVDMGEMRLIGFKPIPQTITAGELLQVGIYWRAREKPLGDYVVSVQLRDASGQVVLESKDRPAAGTYPTTEWNAGEVLLDWHDMLVPASLLPAEYMVQVTLSDATSGRILGETMLAKLSVVQR